MNLSYDDIIDLTSAASIVTVDIEGMTRMLGFSICFDGLQEGFYLPFTHDEKEKNLSESQQKKIFEVLHSRDALSMHNAVHDLRGLAKAGFVYRGKFYDTMLMQHWLNEELMNYKLDNLSKLHGYTGKYMPEVMKFIIDTEGWDAVPVAPMSEYSGGTGDAFIQHQLLNKLLPAFQAEGFDGELWDREQEFIRDVMGPMMDLGIKIDQAFCITEYLKGTSAMEECLKELGYRNLGPKNLEDLLHKKLELPVVARTKTGRPQFDKAAMAKYDELLEAKNDHRAKTILRYRGWQKTTSSNYRPYMDLCDEQAILHPGYKLHGTRTGRLSCEQPNLQQIPKSSDKEWNGNLKRAFIPRDGYRLWEFDYSQLQFRMTVAYAKQMDLVDIFNDPERDIFTEMATQMEWERSNVKTLVYLILFGGGANRAMEAFNLKTIGEGRALVNEFHQKYPRIRAISNQAQAAAIAQKHVAYWTGRRRHFFPNGAPTYRAFNAVIQGGEAEIMKRAMIALQKNVCDDNCRMVLQIHDAIAFEIKEGMEESYMPRIQKEMEEAPREFCEFVGVNIRFTCEGKPWGAK